MCMEDRSSSEVRARSVLSEKDKVNLLVALTGLHSCRIKRRPIARFSSLQNIISSAFLDHCQALHRHRCDACKIRRWLKSRIVRLPAHHIVHNRVVRCSRFRCVRIQQRDRGFPAAVSTAKHSRFDVASVRRLALCLADRLLKPGRQDMSSAAT